MPGNWDGASILSETLMEHQHMLTTPEALQTTSFWFSMEASLDRHDWSSHWPLVTDWTSISTPNLLIMWSVPLATSPHLRASRSHRSNRNSDVVERTKDTFVVLSLKKFQGFQEMCAGSGDGDQHIFLTINHSFGNATLFVDACR